MRIIRNWNTDDRVQMCVCALMIDAMLCGGWMWLFEWTKRYFWMNWPRQSTVLSTVSFCIIWIIQRYPIHHFIVLSACGPNKACLLACVRSFYCFEILLRFVSVSVCLLACCLSTTEHQPKTNLYLAGHQLIMRRRWLWMRRLLTCWMCWRWWSQCRIL